MFQKLLHLSTFIRNGGRQCLSSGRVVMFCLGLSACGGFNHNGPDFPFQSVQERHPIKVMDGIEYIEITVEQEDGRLGALEKERIAAFASQYKKHAHGDLLLRVPENSGDQSEKRAVRRTLREIRELLFANGVAPASVKILSYRSSTTGTEPVVIALTYERIKAVTQSCGNWDRNLTENTDNVPYSNFGCSSQQNLAAMVANPMDLVQPRAIDPASAARRNTIYKAYVKGEETASKAKVQGGNISGVGR